MASTMQKHPGMYTADICRKLGWVPGTRLIGSDAVRASIILITAVGEQMILARTLSIDGRDHRSAENSLSFCFRDWKVYDGPIGAQTGESEEKS